MNRPLIYFKARGLFAHQRILVFWVIAFIALALPWLWIALSSQ